MFAPKPLDFELCVCDVSASDGNGRSAESLLSALGSVIFLAAASIISP